MNIIARISCFFRGHGGQIYEPCSRCNTYVTYEDFAVKYLHQPLPRRLEIRWRDFNLWRERRLRWSRATNKPCLQCGKRRRGCDDCIPF